FTLIGVIALLVSLFIPLVIQEARIISKINPNEVVSAFQQPLHNLEFDLQKFQITSEGGQSIEKMAVSKLTSVFGFQEVSSYAQLIISFFGSILAAIFSIAFITFFFLKEPKIIPNIIMLLTPPKHSQSVKNIMHNIKSTLTRYFIGILLDMAFVATLTAIGLSLLGIKNALLIGLFAGIFNVIPYLGPLLGAGFAILIGISSNLNLDFYTQLLPLTGKIALTFLIIQLIDAMFFQPLVISNTVKAHPLEIFLVILTAGTLAGISGMVVAIPIYTILRIIAKQFLSRFKFVQELTSELEAKSNK
ncbi:MAG: AI-2E family transporter, partial [Bacteroidota bacterium]